MIWRPSKKCFKEMAGRFLCPLSILIIIVPVTALVAPKGITIIFGVASLLFLIQRGLARSLSFPRLRATEILLFIFLTLTVISATWASDVQAALEKSGKLLLFFALTSMVSVNILDSSKELMVRARTLLPIGTLIGIMAFFIYSVFNFLEIESLLVEEIQGNEVKALAALVLWTCLTALSNSRWQLPLFLCLAALIVFSSSIAIQVTLVLSFILAGFASYLRRTAAHPAWSILIITGCLFAPLAAISIGWLSLIDMAESFPTSIQSRLEIWEQAGRRIFEKPLFGWGFEGSRNVPNRGEMSFIYPDDPLPIAHMHPHNTFLQVWLELGAVGAVLFTLVLVSIQRSALRWLDIGSKFGEQALMSCVLLLNCSLWGAWQSWFISLQCAVFVCVLLVFREIKNERL